MRQFIFRSITTENGEVPEFQRQITEQHLSGTDATIIDSMGKIVLTLQLTYIRTCTFQEWCYLIYPLMDRLQFYCLKRCWISGKVSKPESTTTSNQSESVKSMLSFSVWIIFVRFLKSIQSMLNLILSEKKLMARFKSIIPCYF